MAAFRPPSHLLIYETEHWMINHRVDTVLPGYLMVGSVADTNDLNDLSPDALSELGRHLAAVQGVLMRLFSPAHFYIGRYGHSAGHPIHFHIIPVYQWVAEAFASDVRYRTLERLAIPGAGEENEALYDGAEMTLFIWREYCESPTPPPIQGLSIPEVVALVRQEIGSR